MGAKFSSCYLDKSTLSSVSILFQQGGQNFVPAGYYLIDNVLDI